MTATTAPRLRTGNGFKIWHYSGALLYERPWNKQEELWEVLWQRFPPGTFKAPAISYKPVEGIQPSQPLPSKQAYVPPSQRGRDVQFKLRDENDEITGISDAKLTGSNPTKASIKPYTGISEASAAKLPASNPTKASIK
ncbi:eukaryotic translation initiation factor 2A-like, partial [Diaphorina citri]|uniref:Eukaryotic translation initiation factor 2A-like n=1 Tax=Diaphorina citri TaxID=121845 RepID=A0A1S3DPA0_DIACI